MQRTTPSAVAALLFGWTLLGIFTSPHQAHAEASPADRLSNLRGHSSLVEPDRKTPTFKVKQVLTRVWLMGDHATIRMTYTLDHPAGQDLHLGITTGVETPDHETWPGAPRVGVPPAMAVRQLQPALRPIEVRSLVPRPHHTSADGDYKEWNASQRSRHRWVVPAGTSAFDAVWSVPYQGDTYYSRRPRDCSCGEPWRFEIYHTRLHLDLSRTWLFDQGTPLHLELHNRSGARLPLRLLRGGKGTTHWITKGATLRRTVTHPGGSRSITLQARMGDQHPEEANKRDLGWSRSWFACHTKPDIGGASEVEVTEATIRRARFTCKAHGGRRWSFRFPAMVRRQQELPLGWFIRGKFRQLINPRVVSTLPQWPALAGLNTPPPPAVTASGPALPPAGKLRYEARNLLDGKPETAWCSRQTVGNKPAMITYRFSRPARLRGLMMSPGMVKAGWLYEANAAPRKVALHYVDQAGKTRQVVRDLDLPAAATLLREGQQALWVPLEATVTSLSMSFPEVRPGKLSQDLCVSELTPVLR